MLTTRSSHMWLRTRILQYSSDPFPRRIHPATLILNVGTYFCRILHSWKLCGNYQWTTTPAWHFFWKNIGTCNYLEIYFRVSIGAACYCLDRLICFDKAWATKVLPHAWRRRKSRASDQADLSHRNRRWCQTNQLIHAVNYPKGNIESHSYRSVLH